MSALATPRSDRDTSLDLMRLTGVLMIMIAHADPPAWLTQLRNFGTPLLIVASAATYAVIYDRRAIDVRSFYKKRLSRLIIPVWSFLAVFFSALLVVAALFGRSFPFTGQQVLETFAFGKGIGYVWIFPVYMALAIITPAGLRLAQRPMRNGPYLFWLLGSAVVYEFVRPMVMSASGSDNRLAIQALSVLPYGLLYMYGLRLPRLAPRTLLIAASLAAVVFAWQGIVQWQMAGHFVQTQTHRFPPTAYYLSYSFLWINLVALVCRGVSLQAPHTKAALRWCSEHSMWIYFWHVAALYAWDWSGMSQRGQSLGDWIFVPTLVVVLLLAVAATLVQRQFVTRWSAKTTPTGRFIRLTLA